MDNTEPTLLEKSVMNLLLEGEDPIFKILRQQFLIAKVKERNLTGAGFYTYFLIPNNAKKVEKKERFTITHVHAEIEGLQHGAGFVLFVDDGVLNNLEGYCYDEQWPKSINKFHVYRIENKK